MQLIHAAGDLVPGSRKVCLALGFFDGVHVGHQQIIRKTIADARQHAGLALVVSFDLHPNSVVAPEHVPLLIHSLPQRIRAIESLGADALLMLHFDKQFSKQSGETFIRMLACELSASGVRFDEPQRGQRHEAALGHRTALQNPIHSICVGANFVFGHKRSGDVALLSKLGEELNFRVSGIAAVSLDGQVISSTRIREAIRTGNFDDASQMLGRPYSLTARVVKGDQLGSKLGFPTANLDVGGLVLPPNGVYAAQVLLRNKVHRAVLNIGHRPTVKDPMPTIRVEVHVLDFSGDLYSDELEVTFLRRLRDERKFSSPEELKLQIAADIAEARQKS